MATKLVLGLAHSRENAEHVITDLEAQGYNPKDISIVMRDTAQARELASDTGTSVADDTVSGAATGALLGGIAGLVGAFIIPGLGAFLIGGPIAAALGLTGAAAATASGAATGALAGGLIGALTSLGVSDTQAKHYDEKITQGAILLVVPALSSDTSDVVDVLETHGVTDIQTTTIDSDHTTKVHHTGNDAHDYRHAGVLGGKAEKEIS